jgi:hypothetical protein
MSSPQSSSTSIRFRDHEVVALEESVEGLRNLTDLPWMSASDLTIEKA